MKSFLNYSKNRFLYSLLKILVIFLMCLLLSKVVDVHAETIDTTISDSTITIIDNYSNYINQNDIDTLVNYWDKELKSKYPYYLIYYDTSSLKLRLYYYEYSFFMMSSYGYYTISSPQYYIYNDNSEIKSIKVSSSSAYPRIIQNNQLFYQNYIDSNYDLKSSIDFKFIYNDKEYSYSTDDVIPTFKSFYSSLGKSEPDTPVKPDNPSDNTKNDDISSKLDNIYYILFTMCVLLCIPILLKFSDSMFNVRGKDL